MFTSRVSASKLSSKRLDADFYRPEFLAVEAKLVTKNVANLGKVGHFFSGPFGSLLPSNLYLDAGIPLFRVGNVGQFEVLTDNFAHLAPEVHNELKTSEVRPGDILVVKASVGEKICKVPEWIPKANITQHIIGIRPNGSFDTDYVSAFLFSSFGVLQLQRYSLGSIIQYLGISDAKGTFIVKADPSIQKYIGDKVRLAERLRAWAKELRAGVDAILNELNLPTAKAPAIINRVSVELLDTRLDPRPYRTHYIGLVDQIKMIKNSLIADISELASGCPVSSDDFIEAGEVPLIRIRNIGFDEFINIDTGVDKSIYAEEAKYQAKEDMIVLGMDGIFRAQFFLADELPMLVNQRVAMLTTTDIRAELLTHWLNRAEGQMQLNQWAVKTTVEHTSLSDIGRIRIPRLERDVEDQLADKLLNARLAYRYSRFLTTAAKVLVEALIEGQLDESLLIAAQDQLQAGNDSLDRNILNRLKTDGVNGKGQPLFADLDQLYSLLEQASEQ